MSEWPIQPLGELANVTMGQSPDSAAVNGTEAGFPFLQGCAEFGERFPTPRLHCSPPLRVAKAGSTLISVRAPVGTTNRADQDYCIGRGLGAVLAKSGVADDVFLLHAIEANLEFLHRRSQGSTFLAISSKDLYSLPVPAPSLPTQRRIAEILSTLDEAIEHTEALIAKMQQVKAGLMHDLFTRGVTPDGRLRPTREQAPELYRESPLGWIPKEWEVRLITEVFDIQLGKMLNKLAKTGKWSAPYLGNRAVQWDFVDCTEIEVMDFTPSERVKFSLMPGDLLVCEGGDVGRTAMWRGEMDECFYQKAIHRLRPKSGAALPAFMLRFMMFAKETGYFREFTSQSSIAHLTQEKLGAIPTLLPRPDEQGRIAERFDAIDDQIQIEISKVSKFRDQKHGLMHDLLADRVRVGQSETILPNLAGPRAQEG
jgi:type I restriction enzyme, S subunit